MAFLCPAGLSSPRRRRRNKLNNTELRQLDKEKSSAEEVSEFEPTKMIVVRDFTPCVDDELAVKRGQHVKALYQENEWRFVVAEDGSEGFIPYTYCIPVADQRKPTLNSGVQKLADSSAGEGTLELINNLAYSHSSSRTQINNKYNSSESTGSGELEEFVKKHQGQYIVLFDYNAVQEDDINASHGEKVTVLNTDDDDWYWVTTEDGREGFIPRKYLQLFQSNVNSGPMEVKHLQSMNESEPSLSSGDGQKMEFWVKQLNVIHDFISRGKQQLTVEKGELLFTDEHDLHKQSWIWVYSSKSKRSGFVPSAHVRWAQNTTFL